MDAPAQQLLGQALQHHQAGRLRDAELLYRQVLEREPNHPDALHYLGVIAHQVRRYDSAIDLIGRSIRLNPHNVEPHVNLGLALLGAGRVTESIAVLRQAQSLWPENAMVLAALADALKANNQFDEAIPLYRQALSLQPRLIEGYNNLGLALAAKGQFDEAIDSYQRALAQRPDIPEVLANLGVALMERGRLDEAIAVHRRAAALRPEAFGMHANLGAALLKKEQYEPAVAEFRRAIALAPGYAKSHSGLAEALTNLGRFDEAIASYRQALAHDAGSWTTYHDLGVALKEKGDLEEAIAVDRQALLMGAGASTRRNLGNALRDAGRLDEAIAEYRHAIEMKQDDPEGHVALGHALLLAGDFEHGWKEYEWRWRTDRTHLVGARFQQPQWMGDDLSGRRILLHAEQGMGDTLQFVRYAPMVAARGGRVILQCQPSLKRLLEQVPGVEQLLARGEPLPDFELHCPLLSLPRALGTKLDSIPADVPYLRADPVLAAEWRQKIGEAQGLRAGLVWAGRPDYRANRRRSLELSHLAPVTELPGVQLFSLQKGAATEQLSTAPQAAKITDLGTGFTDFAATAAALANLDVLVTADTAPAHLGGAMGVRTWVLLPFAPDFRWMLGRDDSPWYPTMRLFRQPTPGDWQTPVNRVVEELRGLAAATVR